MTVTYEYRVKYDGKYYAPGEPVEVKEAEPKQENNAEATRRTQKR